TFQKRIGRQPVRSMNPGSRNLAYCIQPRQTGPACKVCHYSTHHIVRRWSYRDQLPARIDASSHTECEYPRKALLEPFTQQPGIQEHLVSCALLPIHLTSHYVARRKLGQLVALGHEALTPIVDEHRTLTANSLGYQRQRILRRVQGRWVELYELHVAELHPGPVGHGEPVARGHLGIRGVAVHLAASTRGEHGGVCKDLCGYAGNARPHTSTAVAVHYEIQYPRLLHHFHLIGFLHARDQGGGNLCTCLVAMRMHDPVARVRGLVSQLQPSCGAEVEVRPCCMQFANACRPFLHQNLHRGRITECSTRSKR